MRNNGFAGWLTWLVSVLVGVGVGGLFINGTFTSIILLKWLPLIVHQFVGWFIVFATLYCAGMYLWKKLL